MTNKEAIKELESWKEEIDGSGFGNCSVEAFDIAIKAIEKRDKYRWHDLRKNPDDLPSDNDSVYTHYECVHEDHEDNNCYISYQYDSCCEAFGYRVDVYFETIEDIGFSKIIAWREIELFESEL